MKMKTCLLIPNVLLATTLLLAAVGMPVRAADTTDNIKVVTPAKNASRTVGLDIVNRTVNPDKSTSLTFKWSEKGNTMERTVVANDQTIVVFNGQIKKFSDLTDDQFHAKAVATVGPDGVTVVLLRFGKKPMPKDQLTPQQAAIIATLAPAPSAASEAALNKRVAGIVDSLNLDDAAKQERIRNVIATDLRAVRNAHNAGLLLDPAIHKEFISGLQADLTPDQVEVVKNDLTINKLPITLKVYHQILPNLKPADDAKIIDELKQAREQSLDVKNADEMTPIFKKYKTEIEHYLDQQGYDWNSSYKAFVDKQKSGADK
jgi:Protein of unknown function (DUF3826)